MKMLEKDNKSLVDSFVKSSEIYIGNANSIHKLGNESKHMEKLATDQIVDTLKLKDKDIIYTSGLCEANNLAIYGLVNNCTSKDKIIYAFKDCDSSIIDTLNAYKYSNYKLILVDDINQIVLNNNVLLICLSDYNFVSFFKNKNYNGHILVNITEFPVSFDFISADFIVVSLEKYNIFGISILIKNKNIVITPLFKGGKSTTVYRSGTPALPLIVYFSKALRLLYKK